MHVHWTRFGKFLDATKRTLGASNKVTAGGSVTALFSWVTSNEALGLLGLLLGFAGLLVNWFYRREQNRRDARKEMREEVEHQRWMEKMRTGPTPLEGDRP